MMFVTVFYGVLDPASGRFVYANGGHNPPALRSNGAVRLLARPGGMALAVSAQARFSQEELYLRAGDCLFLYTDGFTEAQDPQGRLFGEAALVATLADIAPDAPAEAYPARVVEVVQSFMNGAPQADDLTCVAVRFTGTAA